MTTGNLQIEWKILTLLRMAILPRWPRQSLGSFWSPRTVPKEASTIYSEKFKDWFKFQANTQSFHSQNLFYIIMSDVRCHLTVLLAPLWFIFTFWWCHREISRSIQIFSLVILTAAMCVSPAISAYLPRDNVMTTEGWCHCHPMSWWPCEHVTSVPGPRHSVTAHSRLWSASHRAQHRPGSRAQWSPSPGTARPQPLPVMWGDVRPSWSVQATISPGVGGTKVQCLARGK